MKAQHQRLVTDAQIQPAHGKQRTAPLGGRETPYERGEEESLSPRQLQIVFLASHGLRDKAIAEMLGITYQTVIHHWRMAFLKTRKHKRVELVAKALREGWIP